MKKNTFERSPSLSSKNQCFIYGFGLLFIGCVEQEKQSFIKEDDIGIVDEIRDNDGDAYYSDEDCDDSIASVYPGANEICDGLDNDCDGEVDEEVRNTYYVDADQDGFGTFSSFIEECEAPSGMVLNGGDCDDENPSIFPSATESCDEVDNNCNGEIDEEIGVIWYADQDEDGFGSEDLVIQSCLRPDGFLDRGGDCDDNDPSIFLGADEECDGIDNNCNGEIDETGSNIWYIDFDGDGFGSNENILQSCVQPEGYIENNFDCDDYDSGSNPNQPELCDAIDNNCNGILDENAIDSTLWFSDNDGDGFGTLESTTQACTQPLGYSSSSDDCDDNRFETRPNALEFCNEIDDNCDGNTDENAADAIVYYDDLDGDGFGDPQSLLRSCSILTEQVTNNQDCDDTSPQIYPYATEFCNDVDDNCNNIVDDSAVDRQLFFEDTDGDGFGTDESFTQGCAAPEGFVAQSGDCDDSNELTYFGAVEICDGEDNNCNTEIDESSTKNWYIDFDGDGFGSNSDIIQDCTQPVGYVDNNFDCDDTRTESNPDEVEICDGEDNDCNGVLDDNAIDGETWYKDLDGDGFGTLESTTQACTQPLGYSSSSDDCDDNRFETRPNALEFCNEIDDNCDGTTDENAVDQTYFYNDADGDGFGTSIDPVLACSETPSLVSNNQDCDDDNENVYPFAQEYCNEVDDNCNQMIDEAALDQTLYYLDSDGDGYGGSTFERTCTAPENYITTSGDCNDEDIQISPDGTEICNAKDDNCDGDIDEGLPTFVWYRDFDNDTHGNIDIPIENCLQPDGYVDIADDCDDAQPTVYPQANELCDGLDNDCDGNSDVGFLGKDEICLADNCLEIIETHPNAVDDLYLINFSTGAEWTQCDMGSFGGGWTQVFIDDMSPHDGGWTFNRSWNYSYGAGPTSICESENDEKKWGEILGGYDVISGGYVENTISTRDMAHSEVWVEVDYISLDSWDHASTQWGGVGQDEAYIDINGVNVWTKDIDNHNPGTIFGQVCGWYRPSYLIGSRDSRFFISHILSGEHDEVTLRAGSTLNQGPRDESFGIDDVYVWVR